MENFVFLYENRLSKNCQGSILKVFTDKGNTPVAIACSCNPPVHHLVFLIDDESSSYMVFSNTKFTEEEVILLTKEKILLDESYLTH